MGRLELPRSNNTSGWSHLFVPIVSVHGPAQGPTAVVVGGVHGDEPEGQIAALRLARETQPDDVTGRLIVVPCASPDASRAYTRLWPNGVNFNRSFPGDAGGAADQQLAHFFSSALPHHEPVGPHPQRLAHEARQADRPGPLEIGLPRFESDVMRMREAKLRDVLDRDDPVGRRRAAEERRQEGGLARSGGPGDQEVLASGDGILQEVTRCCVEHAPRLELCQVGAVQSGDADRDRSALRRDRR